MNQRRMLILVGFTVVLASAATLLAQGYPGHWDARWIWIHGTEPHPFNFHLMTRKDFELQSVPETARLDITAADRYMLFVNGEYVGRGPARSDPHNKSFDSRDVADLLRPGKNVIAVQVYHYGASNNYSRDERAGLFAQLNMAYADGREQVVGTDSTWRVRAAAGWSRDVGHVSQHHGALGMTEVRNANADPSNWAAIDYNDSSWNRAWVIPVTAGPWSDLEPRQTPLLVEREAFPAKVVRVGEILQLNRIGEPNDIPTRLAAEFTYPLEHATVENIDAIMESDGQYVTIDVGRHDPDAPLDVGIRSPFVILDFGRPVFGFPQVRLKSSANSVVDMAYGPVLLNGRVPTIVGGLRMGDRYVTRAGEQTWQTFEYKQFRYMVLVFRDLNEPIQIDSASVVEYLYPAEQVGNFECSDPVLNKLWQACVDTSYLSMEDALICDATRERRVFTGDGAHGLFGVYAGFGDVSISDWYFKLISRGALANGMLRTTYPGTEQPAGGGDLKALSVSETPIFIPQSALVYAVMAGTHDEYFGNEGFTREIYPTLARLGEWCRRHANDVGLLTDLPGWNWIDWSENDMRGSNFQTNALYYRTLIILGNMAEQIGEDQQAETWRADALNVRDALRVQLWDDTRGLFVDSLTEQGQSNVVTEVANGMALMWGIADPHQTQSIIENFHNEDSDLVRSTPLYHHYVIQGLIAAGEGGLALELLSNRFAPMMSFTDPPTIWESFWPFVRMRGNQPKGELPSWVHTGGAGPAWTLSSDVLGVYSEAPGFADCRIQPRTGNLDWARGVFPSVHGPIQVDWRKVDAQFQMAVELPDDLPATLVVPRSPSKPTQLIHNGLTYRIDPGPVEVEGLQISEQVIEIKVVGGQHDITVTPEEIGN